MQHSKLIEWVLRAAVVGEFLGHGVFALQVKQGWFKYFTALGFTPGFAQAILPFIGVADLTVALIVLVKPIRVILLWATLWGFWTALLRPLGGDPIWDFVERWANWGAPLALLLVRGWPKTLKDWWK